MFVIQGQYTSATVMIDAIDTVCFKQIQAMTNCKAFDKPIVIMPDTHAGKGSVIGFTMPVSDKIICNVIGVDIGCGVTIVKLGEIKQDLKTIDTTIRSILPLGTSVHSKPALNLEREFDWKLYNKSIHSDDSITDYLSLKHYCEENLNTDFNRVQCSLGTLGGGNHYCELGKDSHGTTWLSVHSGSRNFGKQIAEYWQHKANEFHGNKSELNWLKQEDTTGYINDMIFAQMFAKANRDTMINLIVDILGWEIKERIESVHNYIDFCDNIMRKGAISAQKDEHVVIPLNMRDGVIIGKGLGNSEWNYSAPHGSGRLFSRNAAKKEFTLDEFEKSMNGIYSTSINDATLDESPMAYKDSAIIVELIKPTVKITDIVKPVLNIKA